MAEQEELAVAIEDLLAQLGGELVRLRAAKGWDVGRLAAECGRSRTTVSQALNAKEGRPIPSVRTVVDICDALGADHRPLVELLQRGKTEARLPKPGPQASDNSRQFLREDVERPAAELIGTFDPLRRENLERSVQWALEAAPTIPLAQDPSTTGGGIFALYYTGSNNLYRAVSSLACSIPLYVGKVKLARSGTRTADSSPRIELRKRLKEHRRSIEQCENLEVSDFQVRYLPVDDIWSPGAEQLTIGDHRPVWNTTISGFGNHPGGPGRGRIEKRSPWDELHPGRPWAAKMDHGPRDAQELREAVLWHFTEVAGDR